MQSRMAGTGSAPLSSLTNGARVPHPFSCDPIPAQGVTPDRPLVQCHVTHLFRESAERDGRGSIGEFWLLPACNGKVNSRRTAPQQAPDLRIRVKWLLDGY